MSAAPLPPGSRLELLMRDAQTRFPLLDDLTLVNDPGDTKLRLFWRFRGEQYGAFQLRTAISDYIETAYALLNELKHWYERMTRGIYASELHGVKL